MTQRAFPFFASLTVLVLVWVAAAFATADPTILPTPWEVAQIAWQEAAFGPLLGHMGATMARVAAAFTIAMTLGSMLGLLLGVSQRANDWLGPWVVVFQNIPALVVIVLCYLWIGLNEVAAITAVAVNKTAMVAVTIREGVRALDAGLRDMGQVFRMSPAARLRHVMVPQLWPYLASSTRNGLAIIWKIVLVVEFLGRSNGIGFQIHLYFQLFETGYVLAYAFSFIILMLGLEYGLLARLEARATAWRNPQMA